MDYSMATLGARTVEELRTRVSAPMVRIGRDTFTRHDLAIGDCYNFIAAQRLNAVIRALNVTDTRDLFRTVEPESLALPNIGAFAFAVLGTCFELKGVGTLDEWVERSRVKGTPVVTFGTIKRQIEQQTLKNTQAKRKARRQQHTTSQQQQGLAAAADRKV